MYVIICMFYLDSIDNIVNIIHETSLKYSGLIAFEIIHSHKNNATDLFCVRVN